MKKMKKLVAIAMLALTVSVGAGMVACTPNNGDTNSSPINSESSVTPSITLNTTRLTLDLDQTLDLLVEVQGIEGDVVWTSSNDAVATVTAGKVKGVGEGTAEITATCGEYSAKCVVEVTSGGKIPVLTLNGDNADVALMMGDAFKVQPALYYAGELVDDVTYTYTVVENTDVASVDENGNITSLKAGTTTVQVKAQWKTFVVYETFNVTFEAVDYIQAGQETITLYTSDIFGDKATETLSFTVVKNGELIEEPVITYEYDQTALKIENDIISILKKENASYYVTATYGTGDEAMSVMFTVNTVYPIKNMEAQYGDYAFEALEENLPTAFDCFTDGSTVIAVFDTQEPEVNILQDGKLALNTNFYGERSWVVHSSNGYGYQVAGKVVTKVITTAAQFQEIFMTSTWTRGDGWTTNAAESYHDGYYVLGNDIEFASPTYNDSKYKAYNVSGNDGVPDNAGFNGVFDGQGHTISGIWLYSSVENGNQSNGIFGTIGVNGVVKNVAFVNGGGVNWIHCYLANSIAGTVDNVFLQVDLATYNPFFAQNMGVLAYRVLPSAKISNVVTYLSGEPYGEYSLQYSTGVSAFANRVDSGATLINNYAVTGDYAQAKNLSGFDAAQLKSYTKATLDDVVLNKDGFVAEYWELSDNMLPVMKSTFNISQPRMSIASNYALSGAKVEITLNNFEHRAYQIVATAGTVQDGGNGAGQHDRKYVLDLTGVANQKVTISLQLAGKSLQTFELNVGGTGSETEVNLNKSVNYALTSWNATSKTWTENTSDLAITGLDALSGKTISMTYIIDELTNNTNVVTGATLSGTTLTIPKAQLATLAAGELKLYAVAGSEKYLINVSLVTAVLTTEEQFVSVFLESAWRTGVDSSWTSDASDSNLTYGGYYVLGNDITFSNTYYWSQHVAWQVNATAIPEGVGFNGIFDGKGYTISNLGIGNYNGYYSCVRGIFGTVGTKGVIRNVAFVNGRMSGSAYADVASYLANGIAGTVENVFIHIDLDNSTIANDGRINVFAYGYHRDTTVYKNCVAYVTGTTARTIAIGNCGHGAAPDGEVYTSYLVISDVLTATNTVKMTAYKQSQVTGSTATFTTTGYNSSWNLTTYKMPVFASAITYLNLTALQK